MTPSRDCNPKNVSKGTQIAYIPNHADGDIKHKDVQFGFVTSKTSNGAFCRFWRDRKSRELRTTANSELAFWPNLVLCESHTQEEVHLMLEKIKSEA